MLLMAVSLSGSSIVILLFSAGLLAGYLVMAPRYWRGEEATLRPPEPLWWTLSPEAWWAVTRSFPAVGPITVGFLVCGGLVTGLPEDSAPAVRFGLAGGALMVLTFVLAFTIARYNRPRMLVPPSRRSEPGLRAAQRERARRR